MGNMTRNIKAFTLVELMIAMAISCIVILTIGLVLADGQKAWNKMYSNVYSDVSTASIVASKAFDAVVRKSGSEKISVDPAGNWVEVQYYNNDASTAFDRYARFYKQNGQLKIERGYISPHAVISTEIICGNVTDCVFKSTGKSAQMILTLENSSQKMDVVSSAVLNN